MSLKLLRTRQLVHDGLMRAIMKLDDLKDVGQLRDFLEGSQAVALEVLGDKKAKYAAVQSQLVKFRYLTLSKGDKGVVIRFLMKLTDYSRQQLTRMIKQYAEAGQVKIKQRTRRPFEIRYRSEDVRLLAALDERHGTPSGAVAKKLCERAFQVFMDKKYERLAGISVAHLYNLRKGKEYRRQRFVVDKTKPRKNAIGGRKKPRPQGQPGFIRIDTVHQGDWDKAKGVYHINAVDEVTQYQVVVSVEGISESYLVPALHYLLDAFPFHIRGFHSDNGSEYVNHRVAKLLKKLTIEFTKSRARKSNDNGLVESKNAAVVRKHFGHAHIPRHFASAINAFNQDFLNEYINFHRPCYFRTESINDQGKKKIKYHYENMMTPYEKLKSIEGAAQYLKPGVTFETLDQQAYAMSDDQAAIKMNAAQKKLWQEIGASITRQTA